MGKLPEGMLNISLTSGSTQPSRYGTHQPDGADDRPVQGTVDREEFTESTVREKIANKWNSLKVFWWTRRESMRLGKSTVEDEHQSGEIFTISSQAPPPRMNFDETPPRGKESSLSQPKPPALVGKVDFENVTGSSQIVFGRERRPQFLRLLRERAAALWVILKQKLHTGTLNIEHSSSHDPDTLTNIETLASTRSTDTSMLPLTVDRDFTLSSVSVSGRLKKNSESTESDKDDPVQNMVEYEPFQHWLIYYPVQHLGQR